MATPARSSRRRVTPRPARSMLASAVGLTVLVGIPGCESTGTTSNTGKPPAGKLAKPNAAAAAAPSLLDQLEPLALEQAAVVDGRELAVWAATRKSDRDGMSLDRLTESQRLVRDRDAYYELRDAKTGKVLRPIAHDMIRLVPGVGILVATSASRADLVPGNRDYEQRSRPYNRVRGLSSPPPRSASGYAEPWFAPARWAKLNLSTGNLEDTDVVAAEAHYADRKDDAALPPERRRASYLVVRHLPPETGADGRRVERLDAFTFDADGRPLGRFPHYAPSGVSAVGAYDDGRLQDTDRFVHTRNGYSFLSTRRPDGTTQDHLLGRWLEPLASPPGMLAEFVDKPLNGRAGYGVGTIGRSLPEAGPTPVGPLWAMLQPDGVFGLPRGVRGLVPVGTAVDMPPGTVPPAELHRVRHGQRYGLWYGCWLVRYALPGEPAHDPAVNPPAAARAWGYCDADFTKFSGPIWDDVAIGADAVEGSPDRGRDLGDVRTTVAGRVGGEWWCYSVSFLDVELQRTDVMRRWRSAPTAALAVVRSAPDIVARRANNVRVLTADLANVRRRLWEGAWQEGEQTGDLSKMALAAEHLGGRYYDRYVLAVPNVSAAWLDAAATKMTDPASAAAARAKAARVREQEKADAERRRAAAAAAYSAQQQSARQYQTSQSGSSGGSFYTGPSSYTYTPPAPSAQQQNYIMNRDLNKSIYGTTWDPYK